MICVRLILKYLLISIVSFSVTVMVLDYQPPHVLYANESGQLIKWHHLPIKFHFDPSVSLDRREIIKAEVDRLNKLSGQNLIQISPTDTANDSDNRIFVWRGPGLFTEFEQARTSTFSNGAEINKVNIYFNPNFMNQDYDFASLVRHELSHSLGIKHSGYGDHELMSPVLSKGQVKNWDMAMIKSWKEDMDSDKSVVATDNH